MAILNINQKKAIIQKLKKLLLSLKNQLIIIMNSPPLKFQNIVMDNIMGMEIKDKTMEMTTETTI